MPRKRVPFLDRYWEKVCKTDRCWEWISVTNNKGYGVFWMGFDGYRYVVASRVAWFIHHGVMPPKHLHVCHKCDNTHCVRPDHLFLGTRSDNMSDAVAKGRLPDQRGEGNKNAKVTESIVREIRSRASAGANKCQLAREYGLTRSGVAGICSGRNWKQVA